MNHDNFQDEFHCALDDAKINNSFICNKYWKTFFSKYEIIDKNS